MSASVLAELAVIALVIGVVGSCATILVMVLGVASSRGTTVPVATPPERRSMAMLRPSNTVAAARSRALAAAQSERADLADERPRAIDVPTPPAPIALPPAGPSATTQDRPPSRPLDSVEEVRQVIDHLVETNPRLLAEVITQWIRDERR